MAITVSDPADTSAVPSIPAHKQDDSRLWPLLAGARFLLALIVLMEHTSSYGSLPALTQTDLLHKLLHLPVIAGYALMHVIADLGAWAAIVGFFIISGYSMAHSIMGQTQGFYRRRFDRIYPVYFVCFLLALLPFLIWGPNVLPRVQWPHSIWTVVGTLFLANGILTDKLATIGTAWTLSIEVFFYLLTPLFAKMRTRWLLGLIAASAIFYCCPFRLHLQDPPNMVHGKAAVMLLWPWLLGFVYYRHRTEKWAQALLIVLGATLLSRYDVHMKPYTVATYVLVTVLLVVIPTISKRVAKCFSYLGDISYPLYIVHSQVFCLLLGGQRTQPYYVLIFVSLLASVALLHLVDYPYRRWRRQKRVALSPTNVIAD